VSVGRDCSALVGSDFMVICVGICVCLYFMVGALGSEKKMR
jgi:hypothetical protein